MPPVLKNPPDKANIWCAGQTFTEDGELVVFGGNLDYESPSQTWKGLDRVFTFNPWTETWKEQPRMVHGRWYPTGVRLPDGRVPIMSGLDESGQLIPHSNTVQEVELFTPSADARWGRHDQDHRVDRHRPRRRAREEAAREPLPAHGRDG